MNKTPQNSKRGFTLVELVVVIAITAILAALLLSGLSNAKAAALSTACKSNLRQIGLALRMYVQDSGMFPAQVGVVTVTGQNGLSWVSGTSGFFLDLRPYLDHDATLIGSRVLKCPSAKTVPTIQLTMWSWQSVGHGGSGSGYVGIEPLDYGYNAFGTDLCWGFG